MSANNIIAVYDDDLRFLFSLGDTKINKASHVLPEGTSFFADLAPSGGPKIGPFDRRNDAIKGEQAWLNHQMRTKLGLSSGN